ncbi:MAG TPA: hypothetical protein VNA30_05480 [Mycobacteriales bacterium]|nr:hypothetical protein [Mycobacteriales bacterium]
MLPRRRPAMDAAMPALAGRGRPAGRGRLAALACCAALGMLGLAPPATADRATSSAPCQVIDFSPTFADDGTAFCASQSFSHSNPPNPLTPGRTGPVQIFTTTDAGRTWRSVATTGLPGASTEHWFPTLTQILFSPAYSSDRAIFLWAARDGLFRSTDAGRTWTRAPVSPLGQGRLTPLLISPADPERSRPAVGALLYAAAWSLCMYPGGAHEEEAPSNALVIWPALVPLRAAGCSFSEQYLVPRDWPSSPLHLLASSTLRPGQGFFFHGDAEVWNCQPPMLCTDRSVLSAKSDAKEGWLDERAKGVIRAFVQPDQGPPLARLVVSRDAGRSWQPWGSADALLRESLPLALVDMGDRQTFLLRVSDAFNNRIWGGFGTFETPRSRLGERIYRTADDGRSWKLVAASPARAGVPTLPFNAPYGYPLDRGGMWQQGSRLFTLAESVVGKSTSNDAGVWCSLDGGRRWAPRCPR